MSDETTLVASHPIAPLTRHIRQQRVILDRDLAVLYGVETRALVQAVKRNLERFAEDFLFQLTREEATSLRSQFVILKPGRGGLTPSRIPAGFPVGSSRRRETSGTPAEWPVYPFLNGWAEVAVTGNLPEVCSEL